MVCLLLDGRLFYYLVEKTPESDCLSNVVTSCDPQQTLESNLGMQDDYIGLTGLENDSSSVGNILQQILP